MRASLTDLPRSRSPHTIFLRAHQSPKGTRLSRLKRERRLRKHSRKHSISEITIVYAITNISLRRRSRSVSPADSRLDARLRRRCPFSRILVPPFAHPQDPDCENVLSYSLAPVRPFKRTARPLTAQNHKAGTCSNYESSLDCLLHGALWYARSEIAVDEFAPWKGQNESVRAIEYTICIMTLMQCGVQDLYLSRPRE